MSIIRVSSPASVTVYESFTADVLIDASQNLGGFEFDLVFDPAVLQVQRVSLGDLLSRTGRTAEPLGPRVDNVAGTVAFGGYSYGTQGGANNGGVLGQITFRAIAQGTSQLDLQNPLLADIKGHPTIAVDQDATVEVQPGPGPASRIYLPFIRK